MAAGRARAFPSFGLGRVLCAQSGAPGRWHLARAGRDRAADPHMEDCGRASFRPPLRGGAGACGGEREVRMASKSWQRACAGLLLTVAASSAAWAEPEITWRVDNPFR